MGSLPSHAAMWVGCKQHGRLTDGDLTPTGLGEFSVVVCLNLVVIYGY